MITLLSEAQRQKVIQQTRSWLEGFVIALNLCPFAKKELASERIRFFVSEADKPKFLLHDLEKELDYLQANEEIETTLLVHPEVLQSFLDFNDFLYDVNGLIELKGLEGVIQVASFHPQYQFANTDVDDVENYTNRTPFPTLHLIREKSLEEAIDRYPDVDLIPERNIAQMNEMGELKVKALLENLP